MTEHVQVSTTAHSEDVAKQLVRSAVEAKLAASGQIFGPASSAFWHLGELGEGQEWQIFLRTTAARYPELEAHLIEHHPWDNPEVTYTKIDGGSEAYLSWVERTTA